MQDALDLLSQATIQLLIKEPFYGHIITGLQKEESQQTSSLATSISERQYIKLLVNSDFWLAVKTQEERHALLKHQLLHLIFGHHLQFHKYRHRRIFDLAADWIVNRYIDADRLPQEGFQSNLLKEIELSVHPGLNEVYHKILDLSRQKNKHTVIEWLEKDNLYFQQHDSWKGFGRLSSLEHDLVESALHDTLMRSIQRLKGNAFEQLPLGLQLHLNRILRRRQTNLDWRRILRLFVASSHSSVLKNTIHRPSKRYGTTPGTKQQKRQKLLVAIDTSASIHQEELKMYFDEIHYLWKQDVQIYVVECDAQIHRQYEYKGKTIQVLNGQGGTDFNPPIRFAEQYQPDAILYFTDGQTEIPVISPRYPLLWVISCKGLIIDQAIWDTLPGRKLLINS